MALIDKLSYVFSTDICMLYTATEFFWNFILLIYLFTLSEIG